MRFLVSIFCLFCLCSLVAQPAYLTYEVVAEHPHDITHFTQGLYYEDGILYEGTGLHGQSAVYVFSFKDMVKLRSHPIHQQYFGEGVTVKDGRLYQLTWQKGVGFVYDASTLKQLGTFQYKGEGWGLTHTEDSLIMSDGTYNLRFYKSVALPNGKPAFLFDRKLKVMNGLEAVEDLNELEYINGFIYANVWTKDYIVKIDPETGSVVGILDLSALKPKIANSRRARDAVLNGIAYVPERDHLLVTGKLWPTIYEIKLGE